MDQKKKKHNIAPETKRNAPVSNWEMFKDKVAGSSAPNGDKIHVQKKSSRYYQRLKALNSQANTEKITNMTEEITDEDKKGLTKHIAMDCEMVGVGDGSQSMLARISLVNRHGYCVYDKYVKPREPVTDYRTPVSGIRPHHLENGEDFNIVQKEVAVILKHKILIGHAIKHDLDVLYLSHPRKCLRDTSKFRPFRHLFRGNTPSLKKLTSEILGREIQAGEHSSIEDARAAMQLYVLYRNMWEAELYSK